MTTPDPQRLHDKHLLRLEREAKRLHQAQWKAPAIPLERPFQKGWHKTFQLRAHAAAHPDHALFRRILPVVNQVVTSLRPDFTDRQGRPITLETRIILQKEWYRLSWPVSVQRFFSHGRWLQSPHSTPFWNPEPRIVIGFKLTRDWWLEEYTYPRMITHQRADLPEVKSRLAEIEHAFEADCGRQRLDWLHGHRRRWKSLKPTHSERSARESFSAALASLDDL